MSISYYATRANLYYLRCQHPDWSHAQLAAAVGRCVSWVEKWLKRFREELAGGQREDVVLQGHSRARKTPPTPTHPLVVEQILTSRDQPPEGLRRVPGKAPIHYYLERDPLMQFFQFPVPSCKTIYRILKTQEPHLRARKAAASARRATAAHDGLADRFQRCDQRAGFCRGQAATRGRNPEYHRHRNFSASRCPCPPRFHG